MSWVRGETPIRLESGAARRARGAKAGGSTSASGRRLGPRPRVALGAMPVLALVAAAGLLLVALGNDAARQGESTRQALFWAGLVVIYAPISLRLLSSSALRAERIGLVITLGVTLYMVKVLRSPVEFVRFDELGWWRATHDIAKTGHAFAHNPFVVTTEGFPGLSTVTAAVSQLTGMSIFHAGLLIIGAARLTLMLALFLLLERALGSARAAGIGTAVYVCNPSFLYFDAQFGYESLALTLGVALLLAAVRWTERRRGPRVEGLPGTLGVLLILSWMLTLTHHMTSLALLGFFLLWSIATLAVDRDRKDGRLRRLLLGPGLPAALMFVTAGLWLGFVAGGLTIDELGGVFSGSIKAVGDLLTGSDSSKHLFAGSGQSEPFAARALAVASVIPLLLVLPFGLRKMWRRRDRNPLHIALAATAVLYPVTLGFRLTLASSETSQRASEFVFVGLAFLTAMLIVEWGWTRRRLAAVALTAVASMTFLGGFIIGELQATRQPGSYLVGAEDRSITAAGVAAAGFASSHLPADSRVLADRTNATLLGSYGGLDPIFGKYAGISVPSVLFSKRFDEADRRVIHGQSLAYVVVDARLTKGLPVIGYYVESDEPGAFSRTRPVSIASLRKFERVRGVSRVYSNGPIVIYDTSELLR